MSYRTCCRTFAKAFRIHGTYTREKMMH